MSAILTAVFGSENILKAIDAEGLGVEEFSNETQIFFSNEPQNPVEKVLAKAQFDRLSKNAGRLVDSAWDDPMTAAPARKGTPVSFAKGTAAYNLGIVSQEEKMIHGEKWIHCYNVGGELVHARIAE